MDEEWRFGEALGLQHPWLGLEHGYPCFLTLHSPLMRIRTNKAFKSFEDWNVDWDIANIDRLELYPGLHAEGRQGDSFGK